MQIKTKKNDKFYKIVIKLSYICGSMKMWGKRLKEFSFMAKTQTMVITSNLRAFVHLAFLTLVTLAVYALLAEQAYAAVPNLTDLFMQGSHLLFGDLSPMEEVLCTILLIIMGDAGRGIATLAVMAVGIGAMLGKVSWGQALTVAVGIGIMFGAPIILPLILLDPVKMVTDVASGGSASLNYPCVDTTGLGASLLSGFESLLGL
jgi:type IV secretion system protein VirB2